MLPPQGREKLLARTPVTLPGVRPDDNYHLAQLDWMDEPMALLNKGGLLSGKAHNSGQGRIPPVVSLTSTQNSWLNARLKL